MYKKMKYILILILMLIVASSKIKAEELAAGSYKIGDKITYNGMDFYVIEDSDEASDSVTMLKAEPLKVDEVNKYGGVGTDNNHVNKYTSSSIGTAYDNNGYGGMAYYSSETCGWINGSNVSTGCIIDYAQSDIKYVVDAWAKDNINSSDSKIDSLGYNARLMVYDIFINDYGYQLKNTDFYRAPDESYKSWLYTGNYQYYWTMSTSDTDHNYNRVWTVDVGDEGALSNYHYQIYFKNGTIRPVVTLSKKVEPVVDSDNKEITNTEKVNVPNTFFNKTTLWLIIGILAIIISVIIIYIVIKDRRQRK